MEKLELAALATIADLVPLIGGNRSIVKIGLEKIDKTKRPGIKAFPLTFLYTEALF
jgi:single-stranded-DNA-specific exonuclease